MTTTYTVPTPYDAELSTLRGVPDKMNYVEAIQALVAKREGYRRAKAEDAPLLAALWLIVGVAMDGTARPSNQEVWQKIVSIRNIILDHRLGTLIAQATGKE